MIAEIGQMTEDLVLLTQCIPRLTHFPMRQSRQLRQYLCQSARKPAPIAIAIVSIDQ
jgi:hypothetical protein